MGSNVDGKVEQADKFESWLKSVTDDYLKLTSSQRLVILSRLVDLCSPSELYEYTIYVTDLLRRDFISLLPAELVDHVLSYLDHESLLRACCVCILVMYRVYSKWGLTEVTTDTTYTTDRN